MEICIQTTLRKGSLLRMTRSNVDLEGRVAVLPSKTGTVSIPLSLKAVQILRDMPQHESGTYFPMSGNAVDMAWDGVRQKINMPELQFKDLRHIGATALARAGANSHQLQKVLGHKSSRMADIYVNLVSNDTLEFLDRIAPTQAVYQVPVPALGSGEEILKRNRSRRLTDALIETIKSAQAEAPVGDPATPAQTSLTPDATEQFLAHQVALQNTAAETQSSEIQVEVDIAEDSAVSCPTDKPGHDAAIAGVPDPKACAVEPEAHQTAPLRATGTHDPCAEQRRGSGNVVRVDFKRKG